MPKGARLAGDAGCVALGPDSLDPEAPRALDCERARANLVTRLRDNRAGLPGEDRLVEPQDLARYQRAVRDELIAGCKLHEVADDESPRRGRVAPCRLG